MNSVLTNVSDDCAHFSTVSGHGVAPGNRFRSTVINNNEQSQEKSSNPAYFYSCATMDIFQKVGHIVAHNPLKSDIVKVWGRGFQRVRSFAKGISALEGDGEGAGG